MINDFSNIEYLKTGNKRQQQAYEQLNELDVFKKLRAYKPILTGTIPIEIDLPSSDLDIICECENHQDFFETLTELFSNENAFEIKTTHWNGFLSIIATFRTERFEIEIFGQDLPTQKQNAYRHMLIEYEILNKMGKEFKTKILKLKREGLKTEPAFAKALGLKGNPYEELFIFEKKK